VGVVNGILYAVGGSSQKGIVEAYDPATDSWTTKASMRSIRSGLGVSVVNGLLYAIGGVPTPGATENFLNLVEVYDPAANTWTFRAPMPTARTELAVGVVNDKLYAIGGLGPLSSTSYGFVAKNEAYRP